MSVKPTTYKNPTRFHIGDRRYYNTPFGVQPGVTTVLSSTLPERDRKGLEKWKTEVGPDTAEMIRVFCAERGSKVHQAAEDHFEDREVQLTPESKPFYESLHAHFDAIGEVFLTESTIWHPSGYAGTVDMVASVVKPLIDFWGDEVVIDDPYTVIDWKTARKPKRHEFIRDYYLQAAAYAAGLNRIYQGQLKIRSGIIFVALEDRPAQVFYMHPKHMMLSWKKFQARLEEFKALILSESAI